MLVGMLTCPACRNPVDVPDNYSAETIRCGICWSEVPCGPRTTRRIESATVDTQVPVKPQGSADLFSSLPGRPVRGMEPLEDLLRKVALRAPSLMKPVEVPVSMPEKIVAESPKPVRLVHRRPATEDLRHKRGTTAADASSTMNQLAAAPTPKVKVAPLVAGFIAIAALTFLIVRWLLR